MKLVGDGYPLIWEVCLKVTCYQKRFGGLNTYHARYQKLSAVLLPALGDYRKLILVVQRPNTGAQYNANAVAVLDLLSGAFRWSYVAHMGGFGWAIDRKSVYHMNYRNTFYKLSLEDGSVEMDVKLTDHKLGSGWSDSATVIGNTCFVSFAESHRVAAIDTNSGVPVWIYEDDSPIFVPVSYAHGYLVFGNGAGQVRCFSGYYGHSGKEL